MKPRLFLIIVVLFMCESGMAQSTGLSGFDLRLFRPPADGGLRPARNGSRSVAIPTTRTDELRSWKFTKF